MDAKTAWPDRVIIDGTEFKARRDLAEGSVNVPYTTEPEVSVGDVITQKSGHRESTLEVLEVNFQPNGSLGIGTHHRHLLTLIVENTTSQAHTGAGGTAPAAAKPTQPIVKKAAAGTLSVDELVKKISVGNDADAKAALLALFRTKKIEAIIGPAVADYVATLTK
jgi:hypothetical protein